jgi:ATP-dependent protease ClpP protease subunit
MSKVNRRIKLADLNDSLWSLHEFNLNPVSREIFLHGYHASEWNEDVEPGVEYRMATKFMKNLYLLNNQGSGNILIHQETQGGDWEHGIAIYDAVKASKAPVTFLCHAHARSMSSITIQGAKRRVLMPNCMFMVHHGSLCYDDTVKGALSFAARAKADCETMMNVYADRCHVGKGFHGLTRGEIKEYILKRMDKSQEWYMDAGEALHYGFIDGIFGYKGYRTIEQIRRK